VRLVGLIYTFREAYQSSRTFDLQQQQAGNKVLGIEPGLDNEVFRDLVSGDWNDAWDFFARNAVAGDWEKNGADTVTRRRGGLTPETPVRNVEGLEKPQD